MKQIVVKNKLLYIKDIIKNSI